MLVGRERERRVIQALVAAARVGESGALVLVGEAGIGKTALLEDAARSATGLRLLRARGTTSEAEVPFGGLLQLLRPALVHLERIPEPQAEALASALALRPGTGGDRFAIGAATLSLLSRLAEDEPVALLVDDAHLLDLPSAQALTFAARRLTADPVVLLATAREGHPCALTEAGLPVLQVAGLSDSEAGDLVLASGRRLSSEVVSRLSAATGGNPLALIELADEADLLDALPPGAPLPVPASLARAFARRADQLSPDARTALVVAAASGGDLGEVARACELLDVQVGALDEAEAADLVRVGAGEVAFRHDLVRSGVYSEASASVRRAVHRALAQALPADDVDRRAWHLGEAATGPDAETAQLLETAAVRARDRSAHAVAAGAFERAARLSPGPDERVNRLVGAAECSWQAGLADQALALLARAAELPQPAGLRARAAGLHGTVAARTGSGQEARDVLMSAAGEIGDDDPDTAIGLLAQAILACFFVGDTATMAEAAARIDDFATRAGSQRALWLGEMSAGVAEVLTGRGGPERIRGAVQRLGPDDALVHDPTLAPWLVAGPLFLRESETGRDLIRTVMTDLRRRTAIGGLPFLLFNLARDQATTDRWDVAEATYTEGINLARETGHWSDLAGCLAGLAWLEARRGRDVDCRAHAQEAVQVAQSRHEAFFVAWSHFALGELELGLGRPEVALDHLERLDGLLVDLGLDDVDVAPGPELVDALVRLGRDDEAREIAGRHLARAQVKGQPWSLARAARAAVMTCVEPELDDWAERAMEHHGRTVDSFEVARTQLAYGARLRRARRRVDAREPLRAALAVFEQLGARPWADQAAVELKATGETANRRSSSALEDLTPQELQVARMLAAGRTTREAAAALFLSPKTIEYHLRHVYIKLDVRSRSELAARIAPSG
ncbi:ATP-binding protein [Angustibacter sp. McL0619]|uniref:ATP-binding protein n=1 Tax=Angustibacter sp. McL0619 TaxID=3415676 RepID=UPI003CEF0CAB